MLAVADFSIDATSVNTHDRDGVIVLKMNGVEKRVEATVRRVNGNSSKVNFSLDLAKFNAVSPLAALNFACEELHKGKDGQSKLWPDIDVKITATLNPICPG